MNYINFLDNKFEWFCMTVVNSVRRRFNQGLLFDINSNKINIDKLNCFNDNEFSERNSKEEIPQNNPSLSQILSESFSYYQDNELMEKKVSEESDIFAKVNNYFKNINI
jgi:hypothetical protein